MDICFCTCVFVYRTCICELVSVFICMLVYLYVFVRNDKHIYAKCVLNALVTRPGQDGTQTKELGAQKEANCNFSVSRLPAM